MFTPNGAAFRGHAAIAMLGDTHTRPSDHEGGCRRNIECAAGIAAGAAGIDQSVAPGTARVEHGVGMKFKRNSSGADGFGESNDFFDRLALHVQRHQQRRNLRVGAVSGKDLGHHRARFFAGERLAMHGDTMQDVEDHDLQPRVALITVGWITVRWITVRCDIRRDRAVIAPFAPIVLPL